MREANLFHGCFTKLNITTNKKYSVSHYPVHSTTFNLCWAALHHTGTDYFSTMANLISLTVYLTLIVVDVLFSL